MHSLFQYLLQQRLVLAQWVTICALFIKGAQLFCILQIHETGTHSKN